jgi:hypothetical protein
MNKLTVDLYYKLFENLTLKDIFKLCQVDKKFKAFCENKESFIVKTKVKALKKILKEKEDGIRDYAYNNKICFDKKSKDRSIRRYGLCNDVNKFTVELLYLMNNNMLEEAYVQIMHTDNIPEPSLYILSSDLIKDWRKDIIEMYMDKLPPILELFGYENEKDFLHDYPINNFKNVELKKYILKNIR